MDNIKLYEQVDGIWRERTSLDFSLLVIGRDPISKVVCFSPSKNDIINLQAKVDTLGNGINFKESPESISLNWQKIGPERIKAGDRSSAMTIEVSANSGPVRAETFRIMIEALEVPSE